MQRVSGSELSHTAAADEKTTLAAAVRLLARREHSIEELRRKLVAKGHPAAIIDVVIQRLATKRLVADDRFVASYVHHHAMRGQGPNRLRAQLRQQGITDAEIEAALDNPDLDWNALAAAVYKRKFGRNRPRNLPERAKQARFLQYRGFSTDQIRAALQSVVAGSDVSETDMDPGIESDPDL